MKSVIEVFFIVVTISPALLQEVKLDGNPTTEIPGLSSLFNVTDDEKSPVENRRDQVCDTEACRIIANEFKSGMNTSVDPCENFYEFVCGSWAEKNPIPAHEASWSRYEIFQDVVNHRLRDILETELEKTDILPLRQAKKWFQACMDLDALEKRGIGPLESILLQVGGWPMTLDPEEWNENEHSWQSVEHSYFHITGSYMFYRIKRSDGSKSRVTIEKGTLPLRDKFPLKHRNHSGTEYGAYAEFISEVTRMFVKYNKADVTEEMIRKDVQDLVEFEEELSEIPKDSTRNHGFGTIAEFVQWYNDNVTSSDLENNITKIDFNSLIRRQFDLVNQRIDDSFDISIDSMLYYLQLTELLNRTPTRTIVNYFHWYFVSDMLTYTTEAMRNALFELMMNEFDIKERAPRWLECIDAVKMTIGTSYAFVEKYFSPQVEEAAQEMIEIVRDRMRMQIDESGWMDKNSKNIAKEKLDAMKIMLGFPDWYKNRTSVLNFYKGLTIGYDHFDNVVSYKKYEVKKSLRFGELGSADEWKKDYPIVVNAFYDHWENCVILPAANFQPPLFTSRLPPSVDYGIVGHTVGHEMGHGFDDNGILLGKDGNRTELSEDMLKLYNQRADCFLTQYNQYFGVNESLESPELSRGRTTRPDNVADSTGLDAVFEAFRKFIESHSAENYKLPGLEEYTDDQMLFISYAGMWCETATSKYEEKMKQADEHSPGRLRVIGPVSNSQDFAKAFNCPVGSPMNPATKCKLWK